MTLRQMPRVGFVKDEVEATANSTPFAPEDGPGCLGGASDLAGGGLFERGVRVGLEEVFKQDGFHFPLGLAGRGLLGQALEGVRLVLAHRLDEHVHGVVGAAIIAGDGAAVF